MGLNVAVGLGVVFAVLGLTPNNDQILTSVSEGVFLVVSLYMKKRQQGKRKKEEKKNHACLRSSRYVCISICADTRLSVCTYARIYIYIYIYIYLYIYICICIRISAYIHMHIRIWVSEYADV